MKAFQENSLERFARLLLPCCVENGARAWIHLITLQGVLPQASLTPSSACNDASRLPLPNGGVSSRLLPAPKPGGGTFRCQGVKNHAVSCSALRLIVPSLVERIRTAKSRRGLPYIGCLIQSLRDRCDLFLRRQRHQGRCAAD